MMQHVHNDHGVESRVLEGQRAPVVRDHSNGRRVPDLNIHPPDSDVRTEAKQLAGQEAVPGADIEDARAARNERGEALRENTDAAAEDVVLMEVLDRPHRRFIPSTLMKKLERTVWNPSVVRVTPGIIASSPRIRAARIARAAID
jgi:hypothetical protein